MPRSRSIGFESSTCASISRSSRPPQSWMMRSASVDLPWSTWAMMEKLRISCIEAKAVKKARHYRTGLRSAPASLFHLGRRGTRRNRDVAAAAAALDEQHRRVAGLQRGQFAVQCGDGAHRIAADRQDDVAGLQARAARGQAFDARDRHAFLRIQAEALAVRGRHLLAHDA